MDARKTWTLSAIAAAITGAGAEIASAGIDAGGAPSVSKGTVTAFGSVYVNGVRFETDHALFVVDGRLGEESDLEVGKVVTVFGTVDAAGTTGTASVIAYDDVIEGSIETIEVAADRLTVLGQTVLVTPETNLAFTNGNDGLAALEAGQFIEVSGFVDALGRVVATYIGASAGDTSRLSGTVTRSDPAALTLSIGALDVDYGRAGIVALAGGMPAVGDRIDVVGTADPRSGRLVAERIASASGGIDVRAYSAWAGATIDGIDAGGGDCAAIGPTIDGIDAGGGDCAAIGPTIDGIDAGGGDCAAIGPTIDGIDAGGGDCAAIGPTIDGIDAGGGDCAAIGPTIDGIDAGGGDSVPIGTTTDDISTGGVDAWIEGYSAPGTTADEFKVGGTTVRIGADTTFANGVGLSLADNRKVEVRGRLNSEGVLVARFIEFEFAGSERRAGHVDAVDGDRIVVAGETLRVMAETAFADSSLVSLRRFTAADIHVGDAVEVIGYAAPGNVLVVTRLERLDGASMDGNERAGGEAGTHVLMEHD